MKKRTRVLLVLVCVMMLATAIPLAAASAEGNGNGNGYCYGQQSDTQETLDQMIAAANAKIEALVAYAQSTPQNDIAWLLRQVDKTVKPVFRYARKIGATVICTYTEYYIDGEYVLIDPLKVVNYGR